MSRLRRLASAVGLLGALAAAPAEAAVVSGSNLLAEPNEALCTAAVPGSCTIAISSLPGPSQAPGGARAAIDGVIVSWSVRTGDNASAYPIRLRVVRGIQGVAAGAEETLPTDAGIASYPARVPVRAGDMLGLDLRAIPAGVAVEIYREQATAKADVWVPALGDGQTREPTFDEFGAAELLLNATIEPDADGDAWGDETQDRCVGSGGPVAGCPGPRSGTGGGGGAGGPSGPALRPNTILRKSGPRGTVRGTRARFRFRATVAGSTFQCKLDKKTWKSCKSPRVYRNLGEGRHTFRVRAVGPGGARDATPAKRSFRVAL